MSDTLKTIKPIIVATYGKGVMAEALAKHLSRRIDGRDFDSRGREHMIMATCWDWFAGGTTADSVAMEIETALSAEH